jgi:hypothetical protein
MADTTTSSHSLVDRLENQSPQKIREWLRQWVFTTEGAALFVEYANKQAAALPAKETKKRAVLVLITRGKWQTTVH